MTVDLLNVFGDRCPLGYDKLDIVGQFDSTILWLAMKQMTGAFVILK